MKVTYPITNQNIGKKSFRKLTKTEQAIKTGVEKFRQEYNQTHTPHFSAPKGELGKYISFKVSITKSLNRILEKFKIKK